MFLQDPAFMETNIAESLEISNAGVSTSIDILVMIENHDQDQYEGE